MEDLTLIIDALILFVKESWPFIIYFTLSTIVAVGAFIISNSQIKEEKQSISNHLRCKGATNIAISRALFDMDKTTRTYNVEYTNSRGKHCQTSCKIQTGFFSSGRVYWEDPP